MAGSPHAQSTNSRGGNTSEQHTVIIGAGIIGCATAYYLSRNRTLSAGNTIHLIESSPELFASASGKSGGFLAGDWFDSASSSLGELSFRLHKELASENNGFEKWGYSRSTGTSFVESRNNGHRGLRANRNGQSGDWLAEDGSRAEQASNAAVHEFRSHEEDRAPTWLNRRPGDTIELLGEEGSVAQVDSLRLSQFLLRESLAAGVVLHQPAKAISLAGTSLTIQLFSGKTPETKILPCTQLLITAGAWTPRVFSTLFPNARSQIPISALAGHSLVVCSPRWNTEHEQAGCHAIFATSRGAFSPEIFSRIGGEVYIAGLNSSTAALPEVATEAKIDARSVEQLKTVAARYLGEKGEAVEVVREGLCFRPVTPSGAPILTKVPDRQLGRDGGSSVFIAAGHGPWGIALSPGTGKVMAEMLEGISGEDLSADIRGLASSLS